MWEMVGPSTAKEKGSSVSNISSISDNNIWDYSLNQGEPQEIDIMMMLIGWWHQCAQSPQKRFDDLLVISYNTNSCIK